MQERFEPLLSKRGTKKNNAALISEKFAKNLQTLVSEEKSTKTTRKK